MAADKSPEIIQMEQAEKAYKKAKSVYKHTASSAEASLKQAKRAHSKDVKSAEKALNESKDDISQVIDAFAGAKLYWDHITCRKSSLQLEEGMVVEVNASGNTYTAVANAGNVETSSSAPIASSTTSVYANSTALGAASADNVPQDGSRNLFITLKTSTNAMTIQCDPNKEKDARDFADAIASAASKVSQQAEVNRVRLSDAHGEIARSRGDTGQVDKANDAVDAAKADTAALDEAKLKLDKAIANVPPDELNEYRSKRRRRAIIIAAICIVVVIIVAAVVYFLLQ